MICERGLDNHLSACISEKKSFDDFSSYHGISMGKGSLRQGTWDEINYLPEGRNSSFLSSFPGSRRRLFSRKTKLFSCPKVVFHEPELDVV